MNRVIEIGRMTKDPDVRWTQGNPQTCIARFTLAVDRKTKEKATDFISCVAFGKTAEFIEKYFRKGTKMILEGRIQTGSYEKDGKKFYTTDVVAESVEFAESKKNEEPESAPDEFVSIPEGIDSELPFE